MYLWKRQNLNRTNAGSLDIIKHVYYTYFIYRLSISDKIIGKLKVGILVIFAAIDDR